MNGEPSKKHNEIGITLPCNATDILTQVIEFLQLFLPETLAKRLVALLLLAIGIPVVNVVGLAGLSERSLWSLKKAMREAPVAELMVYATPEKFAVFTPAGGGGENEKQI